MRQELVTELQSTDRKLNVYRVAQQVTKSYHYVVGMNPDKDLKGKTVIGSDQIKELQRNYAEKLLNKENTWDKDTNCKH